MPKSQRERNFQLDHDVAISCSFGYTVYTNVLQCIKLIKIFSKNENGCRRESTYCLEPSKAQGNFCA